jgi:SAM-dependent methyltransferase
MPEVDAGELEAILLRSEEGALSPAVALMQMLIETEDDERALATLRALAARSARASEILRLAEANRAGCARVAAMLRSGVDVPPRDASVEEGVAFCRRLFDWSVRQSEEASVALYSLASPELLEAATREIVLLLASWGSLGVHKHALDVGCGIGRMEAALEGRLGKIVGIDVSPHMIAAARRRCDGLANVVLAECSGLDLSAFEARRFDLVFAIDSFPYIVQAGMDLARTHFTEAARVLRPGGELVILQFSYRGDVETDRRDVARLSGEAGLDVKVNGETPFGLWNGAAFRMLRSR